MTMIFALLRYHFQVLYFKWSAKLFEIDGVREFMLTFYIFLCIYNFKKFDELNITGWDGMSGSNIANEIFDMEESGEIDKNSCMVPKVEFDSSWKKVNERVPEGNY